MKGVEIIEHRPKHADDRGQTISYVADNKLKHILILRRKKGSVSGSHYHTGTDPAKNPEIQYIISGKVKLTVKDLKSNEQEQHILTENTEVRIFPNIFHKIEATEDTILLELQTVVSKYQDVVRMEL